MRHEETAVTLIGWTVIVTCVSFFALQYWDDIVVPVVSVTGALINTLSLPFLGALLIIVFGLMVKNIHTR